MIKNKIGFSIMALLILIVAFTAALIFAKDDPKFHVVEQAYVKEHIGMSGFILVDTREEEFYNGKSPFENVPGGHIPGAINFPGSKLKLPGAAEELAKAGLAKDITIIVYCNAGRISLQFAEALEKDFGFSDSMIEHYKGGIMDWAKNPFNRLEPQDHETGIPEDAKSN